MVKSSKHIKKSHKKSHKKHVQKKTKTLKHKRVHSRKHIKKINKTHRKKQKGGYGPGACPIGYPLKGEDISSWPGVAASAGANTNGMAMSNHYPLSPSGGYLMHYPVSTTQSNAQPMSGGGSLLSLVPQDLVNLGRGITGGVVGMVDAWKGEPAQYSSNPTDQPINEEYYKHIGRTDPINIKKMYLEAGNKVASL